MSLCSSSGGKSSDEQFYEDGLSEEELRQIAVRQQRQIQLQLDEIRQKQHQINKFKHQFEKTAKVTNILINSTFTLSLMRIDNFPYLVFFAEND